MRELLAFLGLDVPMKYVDQFGIEGVFFKKKLNKTMIKVGHKNLWLCLLGRRE